MLILVYLPCPSRDVGTLFLHIVSLLPIKQIKYYTCFLNTSWSGIVLNYCIINIFLYQKHILCSVFNFHFIYMCYLKYADIWIKAIECFTFLHSPDVLLFSAGSLVSLYNIRGSKCDLEIIIFYCNEVSIQYITNQHRTEQYILAQ